MLKARCRRWNKQFLSSLMHICVYMFIWLENCIHVPSWIVCRRSSRICRRIEICFFRKRCRYEVLWTNNLQLYYCNCFFSESQRKNACYGKQAHTKERCFWQHATKNTKTAFLYKRSLLRVFRSNRRFRYRMQNVSSNDSSFFKVWHTCFEEVNMM